MASPKSKESRPSGRIAIDGINAEQFEQLADLLKEWIARGEVKVQLIMPSSVELDFDEDNISRKLKQNSLPSGCIPQLKYEIKFMLQGILGGHRKAIAEFITENVSIKESKDQPKPSKASIKEEVEIRIRYIEEKVVTQALRHQFLIKSSAKTNNYIGVSWDIVEKRSDSTGSMPPDLVHATVLITAQKPRIKRAMEPFFVPFGIFGYGASLDFENLIITMTLEDLQDMAGKLENAAEALRKAIGTE
ncbi:MAG: hypothetical protein WBC82_03610 [Dehalococcoidia bacterium]